MKPSSTERAQASRPLLCAALFTVVWAVWRAYAWPLLSPDETRYLSVAWEMWLRHDWLVPHLNGALYADKPPALFWAILGGWKVFGVVEWWPRLVPALAAVGALALTARLARVLWPANPPTGSAVWILTTMAWWFLWTGLVMFDLLLTTAVLLGWNALVHPPLGRDRWLWFALAVGAGILIKGPVVLLFLLPPALLAPWWREESPGWRWYGQLALATLAGVALVGIWFVPAVLRAGWEYGRAIGLDQTASRLVDSYAHRRPFWWYLPLLPLVTLPWSAWPVLYMRPRGEGAPALDRGRWFVAAAGVPALAVFSLISGKQVHYLLPLFPLWALWCARRAQRAPRWPRLWYGPWMILGILPFAAWAGVRWIPTPAPVRSWADGVAVTWLWVPVATTVLLWVTRNRWRAGPSTVPWALGAGALLLSLVFAAAPALRQHCQFPALAAQVRKLQSAQHPVAWVGKYQGQLHFLGRLTRPVQEVESRAAREWAQAHPDGWLLEPAEHTKERPRPRGIRWYEAGDGGIAVWPASVWLEQRAQALSADPRSRPTRFERRPGGAKP